MTHLLYVILVKMKENKQRKYGKRDEQRGNQNNTFSTGWIFKLSQGVVSQYIASTLNIIHSHYVLKNLIRFPSKAERLKHAVEFFGVPLSVFLDCTEQERFSCELKLMALRVFSGKKGYPTWSKLVRGYSLWKTCPAGREVLGEMGEEKSKVAE